MVKNFVLDTNVLIHDPDCLDKFEENNILIPYPVIEELDKFKKEKGERGYNTREAIRKIGRFRENGNIIQGVPTDGGGMLSIIIEENLTKLPKGFDPNNMDNIILQTAKLYTESHENTIFVTNDINMQIKSEIFKIKVQEYKNDRISRDHELYGGRSVRTIPDIMFDSIVNSLKENKFAEVPDTDSMNNLTINEFVNLKTWSNRSYLAKFNGKGFVPLYYSEMIPNPYDLKPRNLGQRFLMEALLSDYNDHSLTIVNGPAGTGKTLFALGCGLHQVTETKEYKRVLLCRSNVSMDTEEIGILPGSERDKIDPLLRGAYDNLEILLGNPDDTPEEIESKVSYLFDRGYIDAQSLAFLRGRSITNTYIIIDEVQNCTPNMVFSIISRAGEGSKVVLLGCPGQIDNPRLDTRNNGLIYAIERMKGEDVCEIVTFDESECTRSKLAKVASEKMGR